MRIIKAFRGKKIRSARLYGGFFQKSRQRKNFPFPEPHYLQGFPKGNAFGEKMITAGLFHTMFHTKTNLP